jgi:hypothetical protein
LAHKGRFVAAQTGALIDRCREKRPFAAWRVYFAESYDRELTAVNLFDIQADLAIAIAEQLEITLSDSERALINDIPTQNTGAYTAYIRGLELRERPYSADNQTQVEAAFEEAPQCQDGRPRCA